MYVSKYFLNFKIMSKISEVGYIKLRPKALMLQVIKKISMSYPHNIRCLIKLNPLNKYHLKKGFFQCPPFEKHITPLLRLQVISSTNINESLSIKKRIF